MSITDSMQATITYAPDVAEPDVAELVQLLEAADLDAVVAPHPNRMGAADELAAIVIQVPVTVLSTAILTVAGRRVWAAVVKAVRRRGAAAGSAGAVVVAIHDPAEQLRIDLVMDDLADDRLLAELARMGELRRADRPVVMRWSQQSAGFRATPSP